MRAVLKIAPRMMGAGQTAGPNHRPGVDAGWPLVFAFFHAWPRATQAGRYLVVPPVTICLRGSQKQKGKI